MKCVLGLVKGSVKLVSEINLNAKGVWLYFYVC